MKYVRCAKSKIVYWSRNFNQSKKKRPINGTPAVNRVNDKMRGIIIAPFSCQLTLAIRVRKVRYSFNATPRRIVFISGIPEPILCGATMCTKPALKRIRHIGKETQARY